MRQVVHVGEKNPNSKLTEEMVRGIRAAREEGYSAREIAEYLGVSQICVYKVLSGERWGHVK